MSEPKEKRAKDLLRELEHDAYTMPIEFIREELAAAGLEGIDRYEQTRDLVTSLLRTHKRNAWKESAKSHKLESTQLLRSHSKRLQSRAQEIFDAGHPQLRLACSGRRPEEMEASELISIAEDLALVELLSELDDKQDG